MSEAGEVVRFAPPVDGTLVLVVGMGGMKTYRVIEWLSTSTVMAVGTDMSLKCSWGFFETARGCATHGVSLNRMVAQLTGRPGRNSETPLDSVTLGSTPLDGALFMLIDDTPP